MDKKTSLVIAVKKRPMHESRPENITPDAGLVPV